MATELRWQASMSASVFHAAEAVMRGASLADERLQSTLSEPANCLANELDVAGYDVSQMMSILAALAMGIENNRELVELAATKVRGRRDTTGDVTGRIAGRVAELEAAFRKALPNVVDQLALRGEPLRQQWEARGPGMLRYFGRLTDELLLPKQGTVALVYPALGGGGVAHLRFNTLRIEAVLANPHPQLPEAVRLAWLLSQLQFDLPIHSEQIGEARLPLIARLATLPPILEAAQYVEFVSDAPALLAFAISAWQVAPDEDATVVAEVLRTWWQTYQENRVPVRIALGSLDRMLCEAEAPAA